MRLQVLPLLTTVAMCLCGCSGEDAKDAASKVTKKTVEVAKGTVTGIDEGIEEGRKAAESADGAVIISSASELQEKLSLEVLGAKAPAAGLIEISVGLVNDGERPVRVTGLSDRGNVVLLDQDGYACESATIPLEVTVLEKAKQKVVFVFKGDLKKLGRIRVLGTELEIPAERVDTSAAPAVPPAPQEP